MEKYIQIGDDGKHTTRSSFYLQYLGLRKVLINFVLLFVIYMCVMVVLKLQPFLVCFFLEAPLITH